MKKIVIIGNAIAGAAAAEEIRKADRESEITIFLEDHYLPYKSFLFGDFLSKDIAEDELFYRPKEFYKDHNIQTIADKKVARVDFKKNKVITEEKEAFGFDALLICDCAQQRFPDIKGNNKTGIFGLRRLGDLKDILAILHLVETVAVQANSIAGVKMACAFKKRNKDVVFLVNNSAQLLPDFLENDAAQALEQYLGEQDIRIIKDNEIIEVLGDSDVKAVRLKSGKVIAGQSVIFGETKRDLRIYADFGLATAGGKIIVNEFFKTNFDNVYAAGDICEIQGRPAPAQSQGETAFLENQGRFAGLNMAGPPAAYVPLSTAVSFKAFDREVSSAAPQEAQKN